MRHTSGHTRNRRSHHALKAKGPVLCANCGAFRQKHTACANCGTYKGKTIISKKVKTEKATKVKDPKVAKVKKVDKKTTATKK